MIDDVLSTIARHRRNGILVDTNILLLYFVGRFDRDLIARFKRTLQFTPEDYDTLCAILQRFEKVVTTPHILAELNSLSGQLGEPRRTAYFQQFAETVDVLDEHYVPSAEAASLPICEQLGLTDAVISRLAADRLLVMTEDFALYHHLSGQGVDVLNFAHIRPLGWT